MSNSRKKENSGNKSKSGSVVSFSTGEDFIAPHSPVEKVKLRDSKIEQDPLFYHPSAHPEHAKFFKQKSAELNAHLKNMNGVSDTLIRDDLSDTSPKTIKATL